MVAYSFQKRFKQPIVDGTKVQTLRHFGKRKHAEVGKMLQLYYAMRTKHCHKIISDVACTQRGIVLITFELGHIVNIVLDDDPVECLDAFAVRDGFEDVTDMEQYWTSGKDVVPEEVSGSYGPLALIGWENQMGGE